jgi:membrane fusion protein (multidrug efflux system)
MNRFLVLTLTAALAAACAKQSAQPAPQQTEQKAPPLPADVQKVSEISTTAATTATSTSTTEPIASPTESGGTIIATGEFISPVRSELAAKLPGRVAKMYVDEGTRVSKGQPVLALETDYPRLNLQRAEADVARAKAAADDARRDLDRKKDLIAKDSIPRATFDRSQSTYEQATAALQSAQAQSATFRQQLSDSVLRSPIDGVVAEKRTDVGQRLQDNTVAMVLVQTSPLKLRFRVPERYLATVRRGQTVRATADPYPGRVFEGHVSTVGGVIDPATRSFAVETEFPNRDGKLTPGLFARVEMEAK